MPRFDEGEQNLKLIKGNIVLMGNPDQYGEILAENIFVEDITRAALQTLISNSELVRGKYYRITNAVGSTLSLVVKALTANTLADISFNSANGDVYTYNITTDTGSVGLNLGENGLTAGFVTYDTTPTGTPTSQATTYWDSTEETLALIMNGVTQRVGLDTFFNAKNSTATSIPKGTAVRFAGTDGNSGNLLIAPMLADGTYPSTYYMGITAEAIGNGQFGKVMSLGKLSGVNTNAYNDGDILYVSSTVAGGFQTTAPLAPNNIIVAATVVNAANNGILEVRATLGSNINNDEGVKITTPTTGQLLQLQANGLWENKTKAQVLGGTSSQFVKGDGTLDSVITETSGNIFINAASGTYKFEVNSGNLNYLNARFYGSENAYLLLESTTAARQALVGYKSPTRTWLAGLQTDGSFIFFDDIAQATRLKIDTNGQIITNNATNTGEHFIVGGSARVNGTMLVTGAATFSSSIAIGNTVQTSVATASTHKVTMVIGGVTYYLLATNV